MGRKEVVESAYLDMYREPLRVTPLFDSHTTYWRPCKDSGVRGTLSSFLIEFLRALLVLFLARLLNSCS